MNQINLKKTIARYKLILVGYSFLVISAVLISFPIIFDLPSPLNEVLSAIGASILSVALIGLVYEYFVKDGFTTDIERCLSFVFKQEFSSINALQLSGIKNVYHGLPSSEIYSAFKKSRDNIKILQTWIPEKEHFSDAISYGLYSGAQVRILLLKPGSICAKLRSEELGFKADQVSLKIEDTLAELRRVFESHPNNSQISIRLYEGTPTLSIYAFDQSMFIGQYWRGENASNGPHLKVSGEESYYIRSLEDHFETIWSSAHTVDIYSKV